MLGPADVALFDRRRPTFVGDDAFMIYVQARQQGANTCGIRIGPNDADKKHACAKGAQHGSDAAGAAQTLLAFVGMKKNYRSFLANAGGIPPDVAIEHDIAE